MGNLAHPSMAEPFELNSQREPTVLKRDCILPAEIGSRQMA